VEEGIVDEQAMKQYKAIFLDWDDTIGDIFCTFAGKIAYI
jgi:hypothetical protein